MRAVLALLLLTMALAAETANPLTEAVRLRYNQMKRYLINSAETMPETEYEFRPTPEQRTFGGWIGHTAALNGELCAGIRGGAAPEMAAPGASKPRLLAALRASFNFCDAALKEMTDRKALTPVQSATRVTYPVDSMIALVAALNEHFGAIATYLRLKGITPPTALRSGTKQIPEHGGKPPRRPPAVPR